MTVSFLSLGILDPLADSLPLPFATGLFSFLYHLAYYEIGKYNQNIVLESRISLTVTIKYHGCKNENIHVRLSIACAKVLLKIQYRVFIARQLCFIIILLLTKSDHELQYFHEALHCCKAVIHHFVSPYSGAEALVSCGLLEALLRVVEHQGGDSHLTVRMNSQKVFKCLRS